VPYLDVSDDALASCVGCGLCLPHCPTFRVTGDEALSPRGRIEIMRALHVDRLDFDDEVRQALDTCVQCRGCEPACPSGVPYGELIEATQRARHERLGPPAWWLRLGLTTLTHRRLLGLGTRVVGSLQRVRLAPRRFGRLPVRIGARISSSSTSPEVWILTGCVMDVWFRPVHRALTETLDLLGISYGVPTTGHCCGALHAHSGWRHEAIRRAQHTMSLFPGDRPTLVDSAGCGAAMKEYGHLVDTDEARRFSARVVDVHEWLAPRLNDLLTESSFTASEDRRRVVLQDPCHLRHVQRSHQHVRTCLSPFVDIVELEDDGVCCGAGGAYSLLQPDLAGRIRDRKLDAIRRVDPCESLPIASANPGCAQHLAATGRTVVHPIEIVAASLRRSAPRPTSRTERS
jgi:glycolate oxidase iron-sulfur subunit